MNSKWNPANDAMILIGILIGFLPLIIVMMIMSTIDTSPLKKTKAT